MHKNMLCKKGLFQSTEKEEETETHTRSVAPTQSQNYDTIGGTHMNETTVITIPVGYVAIPLMEYEQMITKIHAFNADMCDEIRAATEKANDQIAALQAENETLRGQVDTLSRIANEQGFNLKKLERNLEDEKKAHAAALARNSDLTDLAHHLNETVYSLKKEIAELNDELLATDTVREISSERPAEEYHECCHALHEED